MDSIVLFKILFVGVLLVICLITLCKMGYLGLAIPIIVAGVGGAIYVLAKELL